MFIKRAMNNTVSDPKELFVNDPGFANVSFGEPNLSPTYTAFPKFSSDSKPFGVGYLVRDTYSKHGKTSLSLEGGALYQYNGLYLCKGNNVYNTSFGNWDLDIYIMLSSTGSSSSKQIIGINYYTTSSRMYYYYLYATDTKFQIYKGSGTIGWTSKDIVAYSPGTWYKITISRTVSPNVLNLYVDNSLQDTESTYYPVDSNPSDKLYLQFGYPSTIARPLWVDSVKLIKR